jgi:iron(III) transport system ATP-binding protein
VLFDEPLSNLDAKLREQMRVELVRLQHEVGITSIYVTHDQAEALVMSDRVVVMNKGVIQQIDDPRTIYARPANTFVANFIGVANLMQGTMLGHEGDHCRIEIPLTAGGKPARLCAANGAGVMGVTAGQRLFLSLRPEDVTLHVTPPPGVPAGNLLEGEIVDTVYLGNFLECRVSIAPYEIAVQIDHFEQLEPGQKVYLTFDPDHGLCLAE